MEITKENKYYYQKYAISIVYFSLQSSYLSFLFFSFIFLTSGLKNAMKKWNHGKSLSFYGIITTMGRQSPLVHNSRLSL